MLECAGAAVDKGAQLLGGSAGNSRTVACPAVHTACKVPPRCTASFAMQPVRLKAAPPPLGPALAGMAFYRDPTADPLLAGNSDSDTDSEAEAFRLRPDDLLILAARNEDDLSHLEVGWGWGRVE